MKLEIAKTELERGLEKFKPVWTLRGETFPEAIVEFKVEGHFMQLRTSCWDFSVETHVPLYESQDDACVFLLNGPKLAEILKMADSLVCLTLNDSSLCTLSDRRCALSLQVYNRPSRYAFPETDTKAAKPIFIPTDIVRYGLSVCEPALPAKKSVLYKSGIQFNPDSVQATDGRRVAIYKRGTGGARFAVPTQVLPVIKAMLPTICDEMAELRSNARHLELAFGMDKVIFRLMSPPFNSKLPTQTLPEYRLAFQADRTHFIVGGNLMSVLGKGESPVIISRREDDLIFSTYDGSRMLGESSLPVTWKTANPTFTVAVNWRAVSPVFSALSTEIINFGIGSFCGRTFIVFDEEDKRFYVLS